LQKAGLIMAPVKYLSVFLIGVLELWGAVPAGLAFKIPPVATALLSATGAATGAYIVLIAGEPLRRWLLQFRKVRAEDSNTRYGWVFRRYGIPGLCIIAPLILGAPIGVAVALALNGKPRVIVPWITISCYVWATVFTALGSAGVSLFHR
jgi:hypothetical protein